MVYYPYLYVFRWVYYTRSINVIDRLIHNEQVDVCFWFLIESHMYDATL